MSQARETMKRVPAKPSLVANEALDAVYPADGNLARPPKIEDRLVRTLQRQRQSCRPTDPTELLFAWTEDQLAWMRKSLPSDFKPIGDQAYGGERIQVWTTPTLLKILATRKSIYFDGTFKVTYYEHLIQIININHDLIYLSINACMFNLMHFFMCRCGPTPSGLQPVKCSSFTVSCKALRGRRWCPWCTASCPGAEQRTTTESSTSSRLLRRRQDTSWKLSCSEETLRKVSRGCFEYHLNLLYTVFLILFMFFFFIFSMISKFVCFFLQACGEPSATSSQG